MIAPPPRTIPLGARLGCWIGAFGWLIGFALVTLPDGARFVPQLAGGLVLTIAIALWIDWTLRQAPVLPLALPGVLLIAVSMIGTYWNLACEPAILASPATVARLRWINSIGQTADVGVITHFPTHGLGLGTGIGLVLLLGGWFWRLPKTRHTRA